MAEIDNGTHQEFVFLKRFKNLLSKCRRHTCETASGTSWDMPLLWEAITVFTNGISAQLQLS